VRAFLTACLAIVVIGGGGYFFLGSIQQPSGVAFATSGARINPNWSWRAVSNPTTPGEPTVKIAVGECDMRKTWQWIFVDFGSPDGESAICSDSQ